MREGTPSRTATVVAALRGLSPLLPPDARLAEDPYGAAFGGSRLATFLLEHPRLGRPAVRLPPLRGWVAYMQVRTRVLDDAVRAFTAGGGRQVVLLGAGMDTRALRLPELADARVFEVDHPDTQRHKRAVLERLGARSGAAYLPWDFEARPMADLPPALAHAGLDPTRPVLTLWEGVTMYLTEAAIDASVRAVAAWSAPGSELAVTWVEAARIARPSSSQRLLQRAVAQLGEPWRFGWDPAALPAWFAARGFTLAWNVTTPEAARTLLPERRARTVGPGAVALLRRGPPGR